MKRELLFSLVPLLFLINFVSAQGTPASLGDFFNSVPSSTIVLGVIWIASFALVFFSMNKVFKGDTTIAGVIALAVSLFITWAANKNLDTNNLFSGIGISADFLSGVFPILLIGIAVFLFFFLKTKAFLVLGGVISIVGLTDLVYEKTIVLVVGLILFGIGLYFVIKNRNKGKDEKKGK